MRAWIGALCLLPAMVLLGACASVPAPPLDAAQQARLAALLPADALLLGEQHEAPEHHLLERQAVEWLAARGRLAAVVLEMAEQGHATTGLAPDASEVAVRQALAWDDQAWPWSRYGPAVMSAVRAGVPVLGANWPRSRLREAMDDTSLDALLDEAALARQRQRIDVAHCGLLPAAQLAPMARVQIARDRAMAQAVAAARQPGRTVLLITGGGHVHRTLGVPRHLPDGLRASVLLALAGAAPEASGQDGLHSGDQVWPTAPLPPHDPCAPLRRR